MPDNPQPSEMPIRGDEDPFTLLAHDAPFPDGAVVPPIYQTSLFTFADYAALEASFSGNNRRPVYSRGDNPTVMEFERRVAALEGAEAARGFASGMAAISAAVLSQVESGGRVVCVRHVYPDAYRLFRKLLPRFGVTVDFVDGGDPDAVAKALPGASVLYLENPTSWVFETQDLPALTALARREGVCTIIDNSYATPLYQKPISHGVDLVVHSASKYLSGHSDTVAGIVAGRADLIARINDLTYPYLGGKLSPFEAWLLVRGMRTLPLRLQRHQESGLEIARRLKDHPLVARVLHPGLNPPALTTLSGYSGLFSFEVTEAVVVPVFIDALRLFKIGVSWGGHESLVMPALAGIRQAGGPSSMIDFGVSPLTVRLHVGLEGVSDLWADLSQALERAAGP
ncbi:PLP-dependent transferase [Inquilinus sp. CAU 1745]|uniref:PLP-dependent transferase n=1 Tax=Inquilinus sp. CAU 1745 TaxID=3140369 RepID=UPI00325AA199